MTVTTVGDLARHYTLNHNLRRLKSDVSDLTQELTTGTRRDPARSVQGNLQHLAGLDRVITDAQARSTAFSILQVRLDTQQVALVAAQGAVQQVADILLRPELFATDDRLSPVAKQVGQAFETMIGVLNAQAGGRSLFSGQAPDQPALADPAIMLSDLASRIPVGADHTMINQIISDWFSVGGHFDAIAYLGGAADHARHDLGNGTSLHMGITASDPVFRETLAGLAKAALMASDLTDVSAQTRRQVLFAAGESTRTNSARLLLVNEEIGIAQSQIDQATTRDQSAQAAAIMARTSLIGADPYETATSLQETIARVDQLFALTARLSRLSLSAYL